MAPALDHPPIWTWDEFAALPDDARYQVLDGKVFMSPHPRRPHQRAIMRLIVHLDTYVREYQLGEVFPGLNVVIGPGGYLIPDIVFVPEDRESGYSGPEGGEPDLWIEVPPELIVEVLSPSTRRFDRNRKKNAYREFGVDEYWIVDPENYRIEVYRFASVARDATVEPEIHADRVLWQPRPNLPPCEIMVPKLWKR